MNLGLDEGSCPRLERKLGNLDEFRPLTKCQAVYCSEYRLREGFDASGHLLTGAHKMRDRVCRAGLNVALECGNIGPSAKSAHSPGDDYNADCRIKLNDVQGSDDRVNQFVA